MNTQQIKNYWLSNGVKLHNYKFSQLSNPRLTKPSVDFLIDCGLPNSCAPGLSFDDCKKTIIPTPNEMFKIDLDKLNDYLWIGSNGCGDPVCIDLNKSNQIIFLNHDNDFERFFINSDLEKFSNCLIIFSEFIKSINATNSSNFTNRNYSNDVVVKLKNDLLAVDEFCIDENSMWGMEICYL